MFLYLAYQTPHMRLEEPPENYLSMYKNTSKIYQDHLVDDTQALIRAGSISVCKLLNFHQMISISFQAMDAGIGRVVKALKQAGLYDNSIIVFSSDNGGSASSSSFPLKGHKQMLYEGGVRAVGFVHSPLLRKKGVVTNR